MLRTTSIALLLFAGCDGEPPTQEVVERELVAADAWVQADAGRDMFAHLRPADASCEQDGGFGFDELGGDPSLEINTGRCNYLTVTQELLEPVGAGDPMKLRLWHFELFSHEEGAEAFVGVAIDGAHAWETTIPIPGPSGLEVGEWEAPVTAPVGAQVQFHLNNHGINSWDLLSITVTN